MTVSIGVATAGPAGSAGPRTWRELFDRADLHLFSAKRGGRNRVRATGGLPPAAAVRRPAGTAGPSVDALVTALEKVLGRGGRDRVILRITAG